MSGLERAAAPDRKAEGERIPPGKRITNQGMAGVNHHRALRAEIGWVRDAVEAIADHLGLDVDALVLHRRLGDREPTTWEEMLAAGLDPETGAPSRDDGERR